jgi:hypothetical protein
MAEIDDKIAEVIRDYEAGIGKFKRHIAAARRVLANPDQLRKQAEFRMEQMTDAYDWEVEGDKRSDVTPRLWAGAVTDTATGEGVTLSLFITWARSDAGLRRQLVFHVGRHLADKAWVGDARSASRAYEALLTTEMLLLIERISDGQEASPGFSYFARLHRNIS